MWDDRFEEILRRQLPFLPPDERIEEGTGLSDLGLDSLGIVELLSCLEEEYGVHFRDEALTMETFRTPGTLWKTLSEMLRPVA
ncbi:acyl carrier protein [Streptosporangium becharense]|uniref:Acyl carrier protein n=1 Tax=Streptosporangium becharense TaxID=1816182 RepID=A0A7W9ICB8_9ACTN|nr:phosphopantetheine-binding protein [Streptosporangium becharense]MBB2913060.1 acyl carrier protein [Streptosporangium becharense]MBB5818115.1 acyl carrier protein [Streptosporangium becharense]